MTPQRRWISAVILALVCGSAALAYMQWSATRGVEIAGAKEQAQAKAAADQAIRDAEEARAKLDTVMRELEAIEAEVDKAVRAITDACNDVDRARASDELKRLQQQQYERKRRYQPEPYDKLDDKHIRRRADVTAPT